MDVFFSIRYKVIIRTVMQNIFNVVWLSINASRGDTLNLGQGLPQN